MTRSLPSSPSSPSSLAGLDPRAADLLQMLTYCRPAGGQTESAFISRWLAPLGAEPDGYGNLWLQVGKSPILWSSHTDTVHKEEGAQRILYGDGIASAARSSCLGADCTVGVWLMREMVRAGIPGVYVWHRAEEIGGRGSQWIATHTPARLRGLQYAIAFDRKGQDEIITHQFGQRCASDAFARSLAGILAPLPYRPSDGGTFTDTANYADLVPECSNLSVGYQSCHTPAETLAIPHALALLDRLLLADFSRLVCARDPLEVELAATWQYRPGWGGQPQGAGDSYTRLCAYCREYPDDVADYLDRLGIGADNIERELYGAEEGEHEGEERASTH